jgi:predicted helicase
LERKGKDDLESWPSECGKYVVRHGMTIDGLNHFREAYPSSSIFREDVFYYIYGLLHSNDYTSIYADNLSKGLPRIPRVSKLSDFWRFSHAGRLLSDLHINYEDCIPYNHVDIEIKGAESADPIYNVKKMKFSKHEGKQDKTTIVYNEYITISGIPLEAYDYIVNGKSALEWVMERQCIRIDKDSRIVNDANLWAKETMNNPSYPLQLLLRIITVSLHTVDIISILPPLQIHTLDLPRRCT